MWVMTSPISARVTPLASARSRWPGSWSPRYIAVSAATVMRLRSRLDSPGRSQTSPYRTVSLSSMSFGATCRTSLRADDAVRGVLKALSFRGSRRRFRDDETVAEVELDAAEEVDVPVLPGAVLQIAAEPHKARLRLDLGERRDRA